VYRGAAGPLSQRLKCMGKGTVAIARLREAAEFLGVECRIPFYIPGDKYHGDAAAHIGFPEHKTVVFVHYGVVSWDTSAAWEERGYRFIPVDARAIRRASWERVVYSVADTLGVKVKVKGAKQ